VKTIEPHLPSVRESGASRWLVLTVVASASAVVIIALLAYGRSRTGKVIPKAPPAAVEAVVKGLADHQPQVVWHALPTGYQSDLREVIAAFCTHMDPEIYDRAFRVLHKAVRVLKEKEDYFARSPIALSTPLLESSIGTHWRHDVGLLETIATSDLSSLASLRQMDPGEFLATTGHDVMVGLEDLRLRFQHAPGLNPWEKASQTLRAARVEFVETGKDEGILKFHASTNDAVKDVVLKRVEGRYVPADMAATWSNRVAQAKAGMARFSGPEFAKAKPLISLVLGALDGAMDGLLEASTQKEFDEKLKSLASIGDMFRALKNLQEQKSP
jgi:hypothetical protein